MFERPVSGDVVEPTDATQVLTIGLFDGIGALRVAADALNWNVIGHVSIEKSPEASRVVENRFPNAIFVQDAELVTTRKWFWNGPFVSLKLVWR